MAALGDLLELVHDAATRTRPAQLTVGEWRHAARSAEAWDVYMRERHAESYVRMADAVPEGPKESRWSVRLVAESADRYREESAGRQTGVRYVVRDGARWLSWDADWGLVSSDSEPNEGPPASSFGFLLDPIALVGAMRFGPPSSSTVAGRPVLAVEARHRRDDQGAAVLRIGAGADVVALSFDAATGALLRSEARLGGEPFHRIEVSEIAYGPVPADAFRVEPPPGHEEPPGRWARPFPLPLHELAAAAPFTVLVPGRIPDGWRLGTAQLLDGRERPPIEATAFLDYVEPGGIYTVGVRERRSDAPDREPEIVDRGSTVAPRYTLTLVRDGTWVELSGAERELLEQLAATLVPAPAAPPALDA